MVSPSPGKFSAEAHLNYTTYYAALLASLNLEYGSINSATHSAIRKEFLSYCLFITIRRHVFGNKATASYNILIKPLQTPL